MGSGWGGERSAGAGVGSVAAGVLAGVSSRTGRGGFGRGRACIECEGEERRSETARAGLSAPQRLSDSWAVRLPVGPVSRTCTAISI
jgi:hypothetical protein